MGAVQILTDDVKYRVRDIKKLSSWIAQSSENEQFECSSVTIILVSDEKILEINKSFLNHDYYTDIITFDYTEGHSLSGELYISLDTVKSNSKKFNVSIKNELHRVMIHGVLHLMGYKDKSPEDAKTIRTKEDFYLSLRTF